MASWLTVRLSLCSAKETGYCKQLPDILTAVKHYSITTGAVNPPLGGFTAPCFIMFIFVILLRKHAR